MNTRTSNPKPLSGAVFIMGSAVFYERTQSAPAYASHHTPTTGPRVDTSAHNRGSSVPFTAETYIPGAREGLRLLARQTLPVLVLVDSDSAPDRVPLTVSRQRTDSALSQRSIQRAGMQEAPLDGVVYYQRMPDDRRGQGYTHQQHAVNQSLRNLADEHGVDLAASVLISDHWTDLEAGAALGCVPILLMTGRGREQISAPQTSQMRANTWYAADLVMAALSIEAHLMALSIGAHGDARSA